MAPPASNQVTPASKHAPPGWDTHAGGVLGRGTLAFRHIQVVREVVPVVQADLEDLGLIHIRHFDEVRQAGHQGGVVLWLFEAAQVVLVQATRPHEPREPEALRSTTGAARTLK